MFELPLFGGFASDFVYIEQTRTTKWPSSFNYYSLFQMNHSVLIVSKVTDMVVMRAHTEYRSVQAQQDSFLLSH